MQTELRLCLQGLFFAEMLSYENKACPSVQFQHFLSFSLCLLSFFLSGWFSLGGGVEALAFALLQQDESPLFSDVLW